MDVESELPEQLKKLNSELPEDRISSLPDEILINILNFLPTNCAFITSTLSRRWSHLFREVNSIDFDDSPQFNHLNAFGRKKRWVGFEAFVYNVMDCIKLSNLTRFRISCIGHRGRRFVGKVKSRLLAVLSHGIQEIDLSFEMGINLPDAIFNCKTLRVLKLTTCDTLDLPDTVCLPCLKILHLNRIILKEASVNKIISGCPLLHDFCMESFVFSRGGQLSISSPSLTKLKLQKNRLIVHYQPRPLVAIVAPLLQFFHYGDLLAKKYSITTSSYLVEAHLDIFCLKNFEDKSAIPHSAHELIQGVSSVKRLFLSAPCMEALTYVKDELPILRNLTKLKLGCSTILHFTLPRLLESAPFLEELIFTEGLFPVDFKEEDVFRQDYWGTRKDVPSCLETQLKVIEVEHFVGFAEELRMVGFFMSNSHSLAQVTIHKWVGKKRRFNKVTKQLKRMARRSTKCVQFADLLL